MRCNGGGRITRRAVNGSPADWWDPVLAEPLRVENGMAVVGDAPD
jgi:hypothetical protein